MKQTWNDRWLHFAGAMLDSKDIDPTYPVLKALNEGDAEEITSWTDEDALWRTLVYVAFYHIGASELFAETVPPDRGALEDAIPQVEGLAGKCGVERRGLRSPEFLRKHLESLLDKRERFGSFEGWLTADATGDPREDWRRTTELLLAVAYNGRWAAYKTCDLLVETHGWPLEAPDAGHKHSSGPRQGLGQLYDDGILKEEPPLYTDQSFEAIAELDRLTSKVQRHLWANGIPAKVSEVETLLCNWHSARHGAYYVGHDIDEMQERVYWVQNKGVRERLLQARREALPAPWLGEVMGWAGIRKELMWR